MKEMSTCRYCGHWMPKEKGICSTCGRNQNKLFNFFSQVPGVISVIMMMATIVGVVIAFQQKEEAQKERIAASQALEKAQIARDQAQIAATDAKDALHEVQELQKVLRQYALSSASMFYLQNAANAANVVSSNNPKILKMTDKAIDELSKEINAIISLAIPDQKEREQFGKNLKNKVELEQ